MRKSALLVLLLLLPTSTALSGDGEVGLLTDETIPLYLARGRELARNQQWKTMVDVLQRIVIGDPKVFTDLKDKPDVLNAAVYSDDGVIYYPARELCIKELAAMPPEGLRAYRSAYDAAAREMYDEARAVQDIESRILKFTEVFDSYLISTVGDDALVSAADLSLELGRYYEALALYRRLVEVYPGDTDRDMPMVLAKAAYCAARIGDREHRDVLLERLASEYPRARVRLEGKLVPAGELKDAGALRVRDDAGSHGLVEDWPMPGGDPSRSRVSGDLPEDLARRPFWRFRLSQRDPRLVAVWGAWQVAMHDREATARPGGGVNAALVAPYPTVRPVVYDGLVLYKDCLEFVARHIGSGTFCQIRSRYEAQPEGTSDPRHLFPVGKVRPHTRSNAATIKTAEDIHRFLDYGGSSIVAVHDRIYVVENEKELKYLGGDAKPRPPTTNLLLSYNRHTGKTLWGWRIDLGAAEVNDDATLSEEWSKDHQAHSQVFFRGPGVASGTMLYALAHEARGVDGIYLWAFDLKQGRVRFRTLLHHPDEIRQRTPVGSSLAVAGGVVYAATSSGILAAVDALPPGRVRWITRYPRYLAKVQSRSGRGRQATISRVNQGFAYNDPVVTAGKVILAPPDAEHLMAFDAETGKSAWAISKKRLGRVAHIVGVSDGMLIMAGSSVTGIDVAKGEIAWGPKPIASAFAYGRGIVGRKYAYVPTMRPGENHAAIVRYDIRTGTEAPPLRFDVDKLGNLLIVGNRLLVANDDEVMCFTKPDAELAAIDARMRRDGETGALLMERALIQLTAGDREELARKDFRRALAAAKRGGIVRQIRVRALELLFSIAYAKRDLTAIEEARGILAAAEAEDDTPLARMTPYRAQAFLLEAQVLARLGRAEDAFNALETFLDSHAKDQVVLDGSKVVHGATAARRLRAELIEKNVSFKAAFVKSVRERIQKAFEAGDARALEEIPERYDNAHPTEDSYFALVRLHVQKGETVEAEQILRTWIERFKDHASVAEAHLRLARILLGKGLVMEARVERNKAVSRLDEKSRARLADLLTEVDSKLPAPGQPYVVPRLNLPLRAIPLSSDVTGAAPVQIRGDVAKLRKGIVLLADASHYYAIDANGKLLWKQPNPTGTGVSFGPPGDPDTLVVAAAVSAGRFARAVDGHVVIGDLFGLTRIDASNGRVVWQRPTTRAQATDHAEKLIGMLRADAAQLARADDLHRHNVLPAYAQSGGAVVSVHPLRGVEAFGVHSGELLWMDVDVHSPSIGRPCMLGQLLAVGWAHPGRVRVYGMGDGRIFYEYLAKTDPVTKRAGALVSPPWLDPLGRLLLITAKDTTPKAEGELLIVNARNGEPAHRGKLEVRGGRYATILYADGKTVVYHDGTSGGQNLRFLDIPSGSLRNTRADDMLREFEIVQDGARLFVFTHTLGVSDVGARLFRVDIEGGTALRYELPPTARAYARPVLTRNHIAIAASGGASARLQLYDREASKDSNEKKKDSFQMGGGVLAPAFEVVKDQRARFDIPPALAVAEETLVFSNPFRNLRFVGPEPR